MYSADGFEAEDSVEEVNIQTFIELLETGEKIYSMYRCARVCGLDSAEGTVVPGYLTNIMIIVKKYNNMTSSTSINHCIVLLLYHF